MIRRYESRLTVAVHLSHFDYKTLKVLRNGSHPISHLYPFRLVRLKILFIIGTLKIWFWWFDAVATPVPIPNTEVKRCSGDDSPIGAKVASRQNQVFNKIFILLHGRFFEA